MRPFKFFFALSLGIIVFLFLARFVIMALVVAAVLSIGFFLGRKLTNFFRNLRWEEDGYDGYRNRPQLPVWKDDLLIDYPVRQPEKLIDYRIIEVI